MSAVTSFDSQDVIAVTGIEEANLREEFLRISGDFAWWSAQYASALKVHLLTEQEHKQLEARVRLEKRTILEDLGKRVTESQVEAEVDLDREVHAGRLEVLRAEVETVRLKGVLEALRIKRDMLLQLGAHERAEMAGSPFIRTDSGQSSHVGGNSRNGHQKEQP